jgi:uncharacterized membrane protein
MKPITLAEPTTSTPPAGLFRTVARWVLTLFVGAVGVLHFVAPGPFVAIIPSFLPAPLLLVYVSGVFEILGAIGIQVPRTRRLAGWGLVLLFIAVFPANINMAVNNIQPEGATLSPIALWARLPFQPLFMLWAWWSSRR